MSGWPSNRRFVTVEGVEGAGKSSSLGFIRELIEDAGGEVVVTREPGGTTLGEELRAVLLGHREDGMSAAAELLLMFAARAEHLERVILPALADGKWVLCDRFTDATYAYQGGGRGIDRERIGTLAEWVHPGFAPALTLLLDVPVEQGLARARQRTAPDRFESERAEFFERVRRDYLAQAEREPARYRIVDASAAPAQVQARIREILEPWLSAQRTPD
jgi:dTMP kinase